MLTASVRCPGVRTRVFEGDSLGNRVSAYCEGMPAIVCPWCESMSSMSIHGDAIITGRRTRRDARGNTQTTHRFQAAFRCNNTACTRLVVATSWGDEGGTPGHASVQSSWDSWGGVTWTPAHVGGREFPDVPAPIGNAADEAYRCQSIGAFRAAIILARSVVEAVAKDKGINTGQISSKIDQLETGNFIRPFTKDAAHELRFLGNDMAHGDFVNTVDADDCDAVLDVMSELLNEVYQGPARVSRMRAKRRAPIDGSPDAAEPPDGDIPGALRV